MMTDLQRVSCSATYSNLHEIIVKVVILIKRSWKSDVLSILLRTSILITITCHNFSYKVRIPQEMYSGTFLCS